MTEKTPRYATLPPLAKNHDENDVVTLIDSDPLSTVVVETTYTSIRNVGFVRDRDVKIGSNVGTSSVLLPGVMLTDHRYLDDKGEVTRRVVTLSKEGAPGEIRIINHTEPKEEVPS